MKQQTLVPVEPDELKLEFCHEQPADLARMDIEDMDEIQARSEFIHNWIQNDNYGPLLEIWDKEAVVKLTVLTVRDRREIRVSVGARKRRQTSFNLQLLISQGDLPESCSNPFASVDFLTALGRDVKAGTSTHWLKWRLECLCLLHDSISSPVSADRETLKSRILSLFDELKEREARSARRSRPGASLPQSRGRLSAKRALPTNTMR